MSGKSYGQWLVGVDFNPGGHEEVSDTKEAAAALIDMVEKFGQDERCTSQAIAAIESGCMWAVKSITKRPVND